MKVEVWGPNIPFKDATFHVHQDGCADTKRGIYKRYRGRSEMDVFKAETMMDVVRDIYPPGNFEWDGDPKSEDANAYVGDVRFFPCVKLTDDR